jgi:hypothetical protein
MVCINAAAQQRSSLSIQATRLQLATLSFISLKKQSVLGVQVMVQ